ncbi:MAG TPA: S8 family serine peptidase [Acidimicrobiales bacterium]|jgi:hypothetical protein|nr:S8 family serine peptidase [Acidimicrobiales bacterium]
MADELNDRGGNARGSEGGAGNGDTGPTNAGFYDRRQRPALLGPDGPWHDRMAFAPSADGLPYPYRPNEVITTDLDAALSVARRIFPNNRILVDDATVGPPELEFFRLRAVPDPFLLIDHLKGGGVFAQVNHGYFAHPVYGAPFGGNSLSGNSVQGNPVYGTPVYGTPVYGTPAGGGGAGGTMMSPQVVGFGMPPMANVPYGTELFGAKSNGSVHQEPNRSSALPRPPRSQLGGIAGRISTKKQPGCPEVFVLDTGLAEDPHRPDAVQGTGIQPYSALDVDAPTSLANDDFLEPAAGHGTFIAGIIARIAPGCSVTIHRVLSTFGDGFEWDIADVINHLQPSDPHRAILSCSFGGYVLDQPLLMTTTIRHLQQTGVQVVASAGNDATSTPSYPAALPDVLGVGALSPTGPAYFTNYGPWVRACAPGYDLLSTFFKGFNGPAPIGPDGEDPDDFDGWAVWSGTSFAAPVVVGNLVRLMMTDGGPCQDAVDRLVNNFSLSVIPDLGTIVNFM